LAFSRAAGLCTGGPCHHHIGVYAYRRAALAQFVALPPSASEQAAGLEQLRAMEAGLVFGVGLVDTFPLGVDTPADLARARAEIGARPR
jgi:3-deoxy-manno-octulosonate cytidylyltransferase (CMP-KDO synthetase)